MSYKNCLTRLQPNNRLFTPIYTLINSKSPIYYYSMTLDETLIRSSLAKREKITRYSNWTRYVSFTKSMLIKKRLKPSKKRSLTI